MWAWPVSLAAPSTQHRPDSSKVDARSVGRSARASHKRFAGYARATLFILT